MTVEIIQKELTRVSAKATRVAGITDVIEADESQGEMI